MAFSWNPTACFRYACGSNYQRVEIACLQGAPTTKIRPCRSALQARSDILGEVAEWSKAAVLKTVDRRRSVGSNPTLSAMIKNAPSGAFFIIGAGLGKVEIRNELVRAEHCAAVRDSVVAKRRRPRRGERVARVIPPSPPNYFLAPCFLMDFSSGLSVAHNRTYKRMILLLRSTPCTTM